MTIWKLPYNCHNAILELLSDTKSLHDAVCNRSRNFARRCLNCSNTLVQFVAKHAVFFSRMFSGMG